MNTLLLFNRQKAKRLNLPLFRKICRAVLDDASQANDANALKRSTTSSYEIAAHLVGPKEITDLNVRFLGHEGATDVITFDYREDAAAHDTGHGLSSNVLSGEIFICVDVAVAQSREFSTQWQSELVRYFVHGVLHLQGYDDLDPALRRKMKRQENRILKGLSRRFDFATLAAGTE